MNHLPFYLLLLLYSFLFWLIYLLTCSAVSSSVPYHFFFFPLLLSLLSSIASTVFNCFHYHVQASLFLSTANSSVFCIFLSWLHVLSAGSFSVIYHFLFSLPPLPLLSLTAPSSVSYKFLFFLYLLFCFLPFPLFLLFFPPMPCNFWERTCPFSLEGYVFSDSVVIFFSRKCLHLFLGNDGEWKKETDANLYLRTCFFDTDTNWLTSDGPNWIFPSFSYR